MYMRAAILTAALVGAGAASAETMNVDQARRFVVGKFFSYTCFDGTRGTGRINGDGSVVGTMQSQGGPMRYTALPPGTLRVKGESVCASLRGMPFEPCFNLTKNDAHSFRGSRAGLRLPPPLPPPRDGAYRWAPASLRADGDHTDGTAAGRVIESAA